MFFRSEFDKWGTQFDEVKAETFPALTGMDGLSRALFEKHLPRGVFSSLIANLIALSRRSYRGRESKLNLRLPERRVVH